MNSRERVLLAARRRAPDRVPTDFWCSESLARRLEKSTGLARDDFLDHWDIDLRYITGPRYIGPPPARFPDGSAEDLWGVRRKPVTVSTPHGAETYQELVHSPLAGAETVREIEAWPRWPSPDWFDYRDIAGQCRAIRRRGRAAVFMGDRLNRVAQLKPAMYLRGTGQIMLDLALRPDIARAVFRRIRDFYRAYAERVFAAAGGGLDIFLMGDDFGAQNGPLLSPAMWRDFLGDGFAEYTAAGHGHNLLVMHHSCGSIMPLVPLMIERGLDILQSLQPEAAGMDPATLKKRFGGQLAFHGGISIQRTMPFGRPGDVRREVAARVAAIAPGGGYILGTAHNIQADTPPENVTALLEAWRDLAPCG